MNFTRWSPRFPGAQRRTTRRADTGAVPAARAGTAPTGPAARLEDLPVRAVLDRVPALVAVLQGPAHHIAYVNDAYTEAFGVRPIGTPAEETMPELEELGLLPSSTRSCAAAAPARSNHADFPAAARTPSPAPRSPSPPPTTARGRGRRPPRAPSPASSSSPPTSPTRPTPPNGCAPANAASARPPSPSSAPSSRRNSNNPTTCASPPLPARRRRRGGRRRLVRRDHPRRGRTALVIGDVMGRGVRAAAVMGQLRTAVRAYARLDLPPHEVLQLLDGLATEIDPSQIATCVYAVHDPTRAASSTPPPATCRSWSATSTAPSTAHRNPPVRPSAPAAGCTPPTPSRSPPAPPPSSTPTGWSSAATPTSTRASTSSKPPSPEPPAAPRSSATG